MKKRRDGTPENMSGYRFTLCMQVAPQVRVVLNSGTHFTAVPARGESLGSGRIDRDTILTL